MPGPRLPCRRCSAAANPVGRLPKISVSGPSVTISQAIKVTKWSTHSGELAVSEQAEPTSHESGSLSGEPVATPPSEASIEPTAAAEHPPVGAESPALVPEQGASGVAPEVNIPKADAQQTDSPRADTAKAAEPRIPARVTIMSSADHGWNGDDAGPEVEPEQSREM